MAAIRVFISHSSKDTDVAEVLIELLQISLSLKPDQIRCTSIDGYRLPVGVSTDEQLRAEVMSAEVFIGIISEFSLSSVYVLFEWGARWGAKLFVAPVLAPGTSASSLRGPLSGINALELGQRAQVQQLIGNLASQLAVKPNKPESYDRYIVKLMATKSLPGTQAVSADNSHAVQYNDNDIVSKLESWLEKQFDDPLLVEFADLDRELGLAPGSAKGFIKMAAAQRFVVVREGNASIRLQLKDDPGYAEDDWYDDKLV